MARRQRHIRDFCHVPGRDNQAPRIGILADLFHNLGNLVDMTTVGCRPGTPLHTVYGSKFALVVSPFIPDADALLLQPAHVGITAQEPKQFDKNTFDMQLFGGDQWKALRQVEAHLVAKNGSCAGAGSVGFALSMFVNMAHEIFVLVHVWVITFYASMIVTEWVISAVLASMADAEQYFSCDSATARSTAAAGRFVPVTVKAKWILVNTLGSVSARSAVNLTWQWLTAWRPRCQRRTTSYAAQPPVPVSSISMGRGARL